MTLPCGSNVSSESYIVQPHSDSMLIGSIDSPAKSALAKRSVPLGGPPAAAAGAVVGFGAAVGAAVGAAGAVVGFGAAVGAVVGAAAGWVGAGAAAAAVGPGAGAA